MDLLQAFQDSIREKRLFVPGTPLLLAVSGGMDSVVLCELCHRSGYPFSMAHCNFQLRGEESEEDEKFVRSLADKYGVEVFVKRFDTAQYAEEKKLSIQEAARELRYAWFSEIIGSGQQAISNKQLAMGNGQATKGKEAHPVQGSNCPLPIACFLLTAHHADDNIETLLMHFFRGTGLHGLTAIPAINGHIRRPLLPFFKEELLEFAMSAALKWREDTSNFSSKYTRNYLRNELIPALGQVYPAIKQNLKANIERFMEIEKLYQRSLGPIRKKLLQQKGAEWHVPVKLLLQYPNRALIYELIHDFGFGEKQVEEVLKLTRAASGSHILSPDLAFRIIRHRDWLIISQASVQASSMVTIDPRGADGVIDYPGGSLSIQFVTGGKFKVPADGKTACLDLKDIEFPLLLRKWKQGDYFYPLGMTKKKKLARFLIDQKLSLAEKEKVWVLESRKRILWVAGYRIDDRFKVTDRTREIVQFSLNTQ